MSRIDYQDSLGRRRTWTPKEDRAWDDAHGIKQGSKRDRELDRQRGVSNKETRRGGK